MGVILTLMINVGTSVSVSHQRFNTQEACIAAGELAKTHAPQLTPNADPAPGRYFSAARVVYFCAAEG